MSLSHRRRRQLHRIKSGLHREDPKLTEMLRVFGKLSAGEAVPAWEQVSSRQHGIQRAAALTMKATFVVAEATARLLRAVLALVTAAGTPHDHRPLAPRPERTRHGRAADGRRSDGSLRQ
jgi:hypothetical protein